MRDSLVVYRSTFEAGKSLPEKQRLRFYEAIFDYALNDIEATDLNGNLKIFFDLTKPLIDSNNKKYKNGCKGGRPKDDDSPRKDFGEDIENVILTESQWERIVAKRGEKLAIKMVEVLDEWLSLGGANAKQYIGKNNYGHFKADGWVLNQAKERLEKEETTTKPNWSV